MRKAHGHLSGYGFLVLLSMTATGCAPVPESGPESAPEVKSLTAPNAGGPITISKVGSNFVAKNADGSVIASHAYADPVIDAALSYTGRIHLQYVGAPDYWVRPLPDFQGFQIASDQVITMDPNVRIMVPEGFSGAVFTFAPGTVRSFLSGGTIVERGTPQKKWSGVRFHATSGSACYWNTVRDLKVNGGKHAIHLLVDGAGAWMNGNTVENVVLNGPINGITFEHLPNYQSTLGANRNLFHNILGQPDNNSTPAELRTAYGVKDIAGKSNQFMNVRMWDLTTDDQRSSNITADAQDTIIIGGIMTAHRFTDAGVETKIIDDWQEAKFAAANITGNVGIGLGLSVPTARLDILGNGELAHFRGTTSAMVDVAAMPGDDTTAANAGLRLSNREAGGTSHSWVFYQGAVGGGGGVQANGLDIWEYGGARCTPGAGGICTSRFQIRANTGNTILVPNGGNVGIGTTTPQARLAVAGNIAATGTVLGGQGMPDVAENIEASDPRIEAGDVVSADPRGGERLIRSQRAYDRTVLGVISTQPGILTNAQASDFDATKKPDPRQRPIVLAGRIPVKVTLEGGAIAPGDLLTTASTPGHAMRAVEPYRGGIIGTALTAFAGKSSDKRAHAGKVIVFLRVQAAGAAGPELLAEMERLRSEMRAMHQELAVMKKRTSMARLMER